MIDKIRYLIDWVDIEKWKDLIVLRNIDEKR